MNKKVFNKEVIYASCLIIMVAINVYCILYVFAFISLGTVNYYETLNYQFLNMSEAEELQARALIQDMQSNFLSPIKEIIFTKDEFACENNYAIGCYKKGKVIVEWQDDLRENAHILCHEVLHAHFKNMEGNMFEDDSHGALDWIAQRYGCYYLSLTNFEPYFIIKKEKCDADNNCSLSITNTMIIYMIKNATSYDYCDEIGLDSIAVPNSINMQSRYGCAEMIQKYELSSKFLNDKCKLIKENFYECNFENDYFVEVIQ